MPYEINLTEEAKSPIFPHHWYYGNHGNFRFLKGEAGWITCREVFLRAFSKHTKRFYMYVDNRYMAETVAKFIAIFEEEANLKPSQRLNFTAFIDNTNVMRIDISPFWRANSMRRGLITILLRVMTNCGLTITGKQTLIRAMHSCHYLTITMPAVKAFIDGKRNFKGNRFSGWYNTFYQQSNVKLMVR